MVVCGPAVDLPGIVQRSSFPTPSLVLTSPPYCRAVEYSRRHKLEMYWLGLVTRPAEHVELSHQYIGRSRVRTTESSPETTAWSSELRSTLGGIGERDGHARASIEHYFSSMERVIQAVSEISSRSTAIIIVVGDSTCKGVPVHTAEFLVDLATPHLKLENRFGYAIRNHYMQYGLRNGTGIRTESVLVFSKR